MNISNSSPPKRFMVSAALFCLLSLSAGQGSALLAASWSNIEPLRSRRADVERQLGRPLADQPGETGTLRFRVVGGTVTVSFVTAKFVQTKKLDPALEGTVLTIVLQHENASDTPESLNLTNDSKFAREAKGDVVGYTNARDGLAYTFIGGKLKTSYYAASAAQLSRAQSKAK
ncbi:MAG: hypothetical protein H0V88_02870 [Pyrinomonadaceae bacterium]|nr:hypothetical protein [Pyrinomonadaceae bacterium]